MHNFKNWLVNEEIYPQSNAATVYHRTHNIKTFKNIMSQGFKFTERGTFGDGLYTHFRYEDTFAGADNPTMTGTYGKIIIKFKVSNINQFLILLEDYAKKIHGKDWLPSAQIKKLNINVNPQFAQKLDKAITDKNKFVPASVYGHQAVAKDLQRKNMSDEEFQKNIPKDNPDMYSLLSSGELSKPQTNCKGIIFYDRGMNGGHNLLLYPPYKDIKILAYAFSPTGLNVPEKQLQWQDAKEFNANFTQGLDQAEPALRGRDNYNLVNKNIDIASGQNYDVWGTGDKSHDSATKLQNTDMTNIQNNILNLVKQARNPQNKTQNTLTQIISLLLNKSNHNPDDSFITTLKQLPSNTFKPQEIFNIIKNINDNVNENTANSIANMLLRFTDEQSIDKIITMIIENYTLRDEIDFDSITKTLINKNVSTNILAKIFRFVKNPQDIQRILGKEKTTEILDNPNINGKPINFANEKNTRGSAFKSMKQKSDHPFLDGADFLAFKIQNKKINQQDVINAIYDTKNPTKLYDALYRSKFPISGEIFAHTIKSIGDNTKLREFISSQGKKAVQYIQTITPEFAKEIGLFDDAQTAVIFQNLLPPDKLNQFQDEIDFIYRNKYGNVPQNQMKELMDKDNVKPLNFGHSSLNFSR
jgi:hypothetical protein